MSASTETSVRMKHAASPSFRASFSPLYWRRPAITTLAPSATKKLGGAGTDAACPAGYNCDFSFELQHDERLPISVNISSAPEQTTSNSALKSFDGWSTWNTEIERLEPRHCRRPLTAI